MYKPKHNKAFTYLKFIVALCTSLKKIYIENNTLNKVEQSVKYVYMHTDIYNTSFEDYILGKTVCNQDWNYLLFIYLSDNVIYLHSGCHVVIKTKQIYLEHYCAWKYGYYA